LRDVVKTYIFRNLADLLLTEKGYNVFKAFLDSEFAGENLAFWKEVEFFRELPEEQLLVSGREIFNKYIAEGSDYELNITAPLRIKLTELFQSEKPHITKKTFDLTQSNCIINYITN
jgi:hypothetical protein